MNGRGIPTGPIGFNRRTFREDVAAGYRQASGYSQGEASGVGTISRGRSSIYGAVTSLWAQRTMSSSGRQLPRWWHVIFDLDGTLADTLADIAAALNRALHEHGYAGLSLQRVRQIVGEGAQRLVEQALPEANADVRKQVLARFLAFYGAHPVEFTQLYCGVPELLRALQNVGVRCTVLTNKPEALARIILQSLGLMPCIRALCGGDTLSQRKPDPAGVHYLCSRVSCRVEDTIMVGDSAIDWATAVQAGADFCAALWGYRPEEVRGAPHVAASPAEVQRLVLAATNS